AIALNERQVYIVFDSDVMIKDGVYRALERLKPFLESRKASVWIIYLSPGPGGAKQGLDDFLVDHSVADLLAVATHPLRRPPHAVTETEAYRIEGGCIVREKPTRDGSVTEPLCNFSAKIAEEVVLDDGQEPARAFLVEGRLATGEALPPKRINARDF